MADISNVDTAIIKALYESLESLSCMIHRPWGSIHFSLTVCQPES